MEFSMTKATILIVDDDEGITELLELLLHPAASSILVTNNGSDAVRLAKKYSPDVVVLDMLMPGINGLEVCHAIREFSSMPILAISALDTPEAIAGALDAGADDFLSKPIATKILIARLNKLLRRSHQSLTLITTPGCA